MNVILDTNILRQDFLLKSHKFDALYSYLQRTSSDLVLPDVVLREAVNLFRRELQLNLSKAKSLSEKFSNLAFDKTTSLQYSCNIDSEVEAYRKFLLSSKKFVSSTIIPINPEHLSETINRLIEGKKPASTTGKEFRDIVIWLSIKDYLIKNKSQKIAFISANTKEFADESGTQLSSELKDELTSQNPELLYYNSIEGFIKEQASKIDYITQQWLEENIPENTIYNLALDKISSSEYRFERYAEKEVNDFSGSLTVTNVKPSFWDYFVYDMHSDGVYLNLSYSAEVEIEIELSTPDPELYGSVYASRYRRLHSEKETTEMLYPEVNLYYSARIINGKVVDIELDDWDLA